MHLGLEVIYNIILYNISSLYIVNIQYKNEAFARWYKLIGNKTKYKYIFIINHIHDLQNASEIIHKYAYTVWNYFI